MQINLPPFKHILSYYYKQKYDNISVYSNDVLNTFNAFLDYDKAEDDATSISLESQLLIWKSFELTINKNQLDILKCIKFEILLIEQKIKINL
jgi:hypothetical protein